MAQKALAKTRGSVQKTTLTANSILQRSSNKRCEMKKTALQRSAAGPAAERVPPIVHEVLRSPGRPLDPAARTFIEPRFGHDFSKVQVHTDPKAAESARSVSALAYTVGNDIVFGAEQYRPETGTGLILLMHELTHVVQQHQTPLPNVPNDLTIDPPDSAYESAARGSEEGMHLSIKSGLLARSALQRLPICYRPGAAPQPGQAGDCTARDPENCPTFELWINAFSTLTTFPARDTAPGGKELTGSIVIGEIATRPIDIEEGEPISEESLAAPAIAPQAADRFIDHPTDQWVRTCLPPNLRETAYRLPSDCADIPVILRHVWLSAHQRTETYSFPTAGNQRRRLKIGDQASRAQTMRIHQIIGQVHSGNVARLVNSYANSRGQPLRTFSELQNLLHPGDILVWEHHEGGLGTGRTGGHTQTITSIERDGPNNPIRRINVVQGNQPIFEEQASEIREYNERRAPPERALQRAPGRRIETSSLRSSDLQDLQIPAVRGRASSGPRTWVWTLRDGHTTIVAAGPPASSRRPSMRRLHGQTIRRISDWFPSLTNISLDRFSGVFEAALLEVRAMIESGEVVSDQDAIDLGRVAGERLQILISRRRPRSGGPSEFAPLSAMIRALGDPGRDVGFSSAATPESENVRLTFEIILQAFDSEQP